jgi:hypothetical protein
VKGREQQLEWKQQPAQGHEIRDTESMFVAISTLDYMVYTIKGVSGS